MGTKIGKKIGKKMNVGKDTGTVAEIDAGIDAGFDTQPDIGTGMSSVVLDCPSIGFLGPRGTFSQVALEKYAGDRPHKVRDYSTFMDMLMAVERGEIQEAVVPIENSLEGAINEILDIIAFDVDLVVKAELAILVEQNLLTKPGVTLSTITSVTSISQAIGQCRKFLGTKLPGVPVKLVYSTAQAAGEVAKGAPGHAAVGSLAAAREFGLSILARGIQDGENNITRFVVLGKESSKRTGHDKTSIVFSTEDKPGSLYRILDIFSLWDVNMTRIESRPAKKRLGRYIFFVDVEGHIDDPDMKDALTMIMRKTSFYKFLGSYPRYDSEAENEGLRD
ncbi:MAG: prephenate dehydratase [Clostridiales bacterium]|nr:prephenate dehydratase [Clostridiales bacterium]